MRSYLTYLKGVPEKGFYKKEYFMLNVVFIAGLLVFSYAGLRQIEQHSVYIPSHIVSSTPADLQMKYENLVISTEDKQMINGWFIPVADPEMVSSVPTILYCHGNGGSISHRVEIAKVFHDHNYNFLIFDYRGYGKSSGKPSEKGLYRDATAAYYYLLSRKDINHKKIVLYGHSLGGTVAVDLATREPGIAILILEGTPCSTMAVVKDVISLPVGFLMTQRFDALSKIGKVKMPKMIFHSVEDEVIPFQNGEKLYEKAVEPKEFHALKGGHNTSFVFFANDYLGYINKFLELQGIS